MLQATDAHVETYYLWYSQARTLALLICHMSLSLINALPCRSTQSCLWVSVRPCSHAPLLQRDFSKSNLTVCGCAGLLLTFLRRYSYRHALHSFAIMQQSHSHTLLAVPSR